MEKLSETILTIFNVNNLGSMKNALLVLLGKVIWAIAILFIAWIVVKIGNKFIHKIMNKKIDIKTKGEKNLSSFEGIVKSVFKVFVYLIAILSILTGVFKLLDASSLVTTVGVGGLALSIGAQSLISDIISGFFLIYENQMSVGDWVTIGSNQGTVIALELRCLKLETYEGEMVYVPYGEIRNLVNKSKLESSIIVDVPISYKQDISKAVETLEEVALNFESKDLTSNLKVMPPVTLDDETYKLRVFGKCKPCANWELERLIRKEIVDKARTNNINLGFDLSLQK
ncbi:MAG: mechanosensitive ion channel family protein [Clostridia bacterium]|nr:mechanosensitive ion channel family protein [Clostridia bacterium]